MLRQVRPTPGTFVVRGGDLLVVVWTKNLLGSVVDSYRRILRYLFPILLPRRLRNCEEEDAVVSIDNDFPAAADAAKLEGRVLEIGGNAPSGVGFDNSKAWILERFIIEVVGVCGRNVRLRVFTGLLCSGCCGIENSGVAQSHPPRRRDGDAVVLQRDFAGDGLRLNHAFKPSLLNLTPIHVLRGCATGGAILALLLLLFCTGVNGRTSRRGSDSDVATKRIWPRTFPCLSLM